MITERIPLWEGRDDVALYTMLRHCTPNPMIPVEAEPLPAVIVCPGGAYMFCSMENEGDEVALRVWEIAAERLGMGISLLIDLLNPEAIVIGSIFERSEHLLRAGVERVISREALPQSARVCRILPAALGDEIGDYAAIAVAMKEIN